MKLGISKVVAFASVGGMHSELHPGLVLIPDDYVNFWTTVSLNNNKDSAIIPGYDSVLRGKLVEIVKKEEIKFQDGGVYLQTIGPRFETKAEIKVLSGFGHVVGMTGADEATLFREGKVGYATICMIDNYANGISQAKNLEFGDFLEGVKRNLKVVESIALRVIQEV